MAARWFATASLAVAMVFTIATALVSIEIAGQARSTASTDPAPSAVPVPSQAIPSLESLLAANQLTFAQRDGIYHVILTNDDHAVKVTCGEATMYHDPQQRPVKMVWLWTQIATIPKGAAPPAALLLKIAEINDGLRPGNISVNSESGGVYYNSSLWLDTTTPQVLYDELAYAFHRQAELRKLLLPFVNEE
ncbi:MAG: hypothetical protein K1X74_21100 [Pirellulales bacterium]|nr:hypothetical protein [Pirellulales bacterium]